jgi:hypothetical protein
MILVQTLTCDTGAVASSPSLVLASTYSSSRDLKKRRKSSSIFANENDGLQASFRVSSFHFIGPFTTNEIATRSHRRYFLANKNEGVPPQKIRFYSSEFGERRDEDKKYAMDFDLGSRNKKLMKEQEARREKARQKLQREKELQEQAAKLRMDLEIENQRRKAEQLKREEEVQNIHIT